MAQGVIQDLLPPVSHKQDDWMVVAQKTPDYLYTNDPANRDKPMATGASIGQPGTFTPAGSNPPSTLAAMAGVTATPATAWGAGNYVQGPTYKATWNASAWISYP